MADLQVRIAYLENALAWIRHTAGMHYMGAAFEPEHMRHLANMAADAILGEREFPDIDGAYRQAQERAQEFAAKWREPLGWDGPDAADEEVPGVD